MCWTDEIWYVGSWDTSRNGPASCGHCVVQGSHRCTRARTRVRSRLFGWLPSRYEWKAGKAFCVKREKVTHRVCGLCPVCSMSPSAKCAEDLSPASITQRPQLCNKRENVSTYSRSTAYTQCSQDDDTSRASEDMQAGSREKLRQAEKLQRGRGREVSARRDMMLDDIRARAVQRAVIQRGEVSERAAQLGRPSGEIYLPAVPAPPPAHLVSRRRAVAASPLERHSAPLPPPRASGRTNISRRPVPGAGVPRWRSESGAVGGDPRVFDAAMLPEPLSIAARQDGAARQRGRMEESPSSRAIMPPQPSMNAALMIDELEDYVNGELAGQVSGYGVVRPSQRQSALGVVRHGAAVHPSVNRSWV